MTKRFIAQEITNDSVDVAVARVHDAYGERGYVRELVGKMRRARLLSQLREAAQQGIAERQGAK
jgi:hypothetical protein